MAQQLYDAIAHSPEAMQKINDVEAGVDMDYINSVKALA